MAFTGTGRWNLKTFKRAARSAAAALIQLLAAVALLGLTLAAPGWIVAGSVLQTATEPATYQRALAADPSLVTRYQGDVMWLYWNYTLAVAPLTGAPSRVGRPEATWRAMGAALLPAGWLAQQADLAAPAILAWLDSDAPLPGVFFDLTAVNARLGGPDGTLALLSLLEATPFCATDETTAGLSIFAPCLPAGANLQSLAARSALEIAAVAPASMDLASLVSAGLVDPEFTANLDWARHALHWFRLALPVGRDVCLLLFALYLLLTARGGAGLVRSLAPPLLCPGLVSLALAGAAYGLHAWLGSPQSAGFEVYLASGVGQVVRVLGPAATQAAMRALIAWGLGLVVAGTLCWLARRLIKPAAPTPARRPTRVRRQFV